MAIIDLYSKREKRKMMQGQEDVYQYDTLPESFRVQVVHLWNDALGVWYVGPYGSRNDSRKRWTTLYDFYRREKGMFQLVARRSNPSDQLQEYFLSASTEDAIDIIDLIFRFIDFSLRKMPEMERRHFNLEAPDNVIDELNGRFREHAIGFQFEGGEIIRVDSRYLHAEAVKPAVQLLHGAGADFSGAFQEFMAAHERYRKGEEKDTITWALKAFESTLKAICAVRGWAFDSTKDTASKLLEIVFARNLVPPYVQAQFTALRSVLESGVPTVRNKTSGHGQGSTPTEVPQHLTRYVLNLAASNIVFLIESHQAMK